MSRAAAAPVALPARRLITDLAAVTALLAVAVVGFGPTFEGLSYLFTGFGAIALGLAIAWMGARWRWGLLAVAGATVLAYALFAGPFALAHTTLVGIIPTVDTFVRAGTGVVTAWKEILTTVPPVAPADGHLLVPFIIFLVTAVIAGSIALRAKRPAWALIPAAVALIAQILLGVAQTAAPLVQGILFAVVAAVWLALRQTWDPRLAAVRVEDERGGPEVKRLRQRRIVSGGLILALAAGAGVATAAVLDPPTQRFVLRDFIVPPFDIHQYPSPLQSFRGVVKEGEDKGTVLFTVTGLPEDERIRLATMDTYNGIVFNVSDDATGSSSSFTPARSNMSPDAEGEAVTLEFAVNGFGGVWVPDAGAVKEFRFEGDRGSDLRRSTHFNDATGTAIATLGLQKGDAYEISTIFTEIPSDTALEGVALSPFKRPKQEGVPDALAELASVITEDAETPIARVRALEDYLSTDGFFSHGLEGEVRSPSGHGAARIAQLVGGDQMIGDDEQYAVAMALLADRLGIPARVVMGWHADEKNPATEPFEATGQNLHVWVEVPFEGYGWLPFDPTPDEDNEPNQQTTKPQANPKPQVLQPPPPAQEPAELPPTIADGRDQEEEEDLGFDWLGPILFYGGISLAVIALILAPFLIVGAFKASRRLKRRRAARTADQISGGWDEVIDYAVDLRTPVASGATRAESAAVVGSHFDQERVVALATRADEDVFGPDDPSEEAVDDFWREVDDIVDGMRGSTSMGKRLKARLSLRSFRLDASALDPRRIDVQRLDPRRLLSSRKPPQ